MKKLLYILPLLGLMASGCSDDEVMSGAKQTEHLTLQFEAMIPVDDDVTRSIDGDPGVYEKFEKPHHLHTFVYVEQGSDKKAIYHFHKTFETDAKADEAWTLNGDRTCYNYSYTEDIQWGSANANFQIENEADRQNLKLRAYIVASHEPIVFGGKSLGDGNTTVLSNDFTEQDILNLTFSAKVNDSYINLRDIYSTPYNLSKSRTEMTSSPLTNREGYYGTLSQSLVDKKIFLVADTLYHTCAKVDFEWNTESIYQANTAESIVLGGASKTLPSSGYIFRPAENVSGTSYTNTYSKLLLGVMGNGYAYVAPSAIATDETFKISTTSNGIEYYLYYCKLDNTSGFAVSKQTDPDKGTAYTIDQADYFKLEPTGTANKYYIYDVTQGKYVKYEGNYSNNVVDLQEGKVGNTTWWIKENNGFYFIVPGEADYNQISSSSSNVFSWRFNGDDLRWVANMVVAPCNLNSSVNSRSWRFLKKGAISPNADDRNDYTLCTPGNKWSGRAYTYVIQPNADVVDYTFKTTKGGGEGQLNPANDIRLEGCMSNVFPSWYKVNVKIKEAQPAQ